MKIKNLFVLALMIVSILAMGGIATATNSLPVELIEVEVEDVDANDGEIPGLEKANEIEVKVKFKALADIDDVQVEAQLRGYDHKDLMEDITSAFDVHNGTTYVKTLDIDLKERMDADRYNLRVIISDRHDDQTYGFELDVASTEHAVVIRDVVVSPSNGVKAGRSLLATVRVQNRGSSTEEDVKVSFSIPDLGITQSAYIDELEEDGDSNNRDSKSTEELYLRIPQCAEAGIYEAIVEVEYDDGDEYEREYMDIEVLADDTCEVGYVPTSSGSSTSSSSTATTSTGGKTVITLGTDDQDITKGAGGVIYPVTITNGGNTAKTYVLSVKGGDWGTFKVSPTNVVTLGRGETQSVYIYASAKPTAAAGNQVFAVAIKSGDKTLKEISFSAKIIEGSSAMGKLKKVLEVGLIVLVAILFIIGLIIGFNKLKGNEEEENEEGQSYY
jgi:hypothetical protein